MRFPPAPPVLRRLATMEQITKEEWREKTRPLWPDEWDDSDFDRAWEQFQELKRWRTAH